MKKGVSNEERDKALKEMFGSEIEQTAILGDTQPIKRNEVVATSEHIEPNETDVYTPPEDAAQTEKVATAVPDTTDDPEMIAAPSECGRATSSAPDRGIETSGRTIITISGDEVAERSEVTVPPESEARTLPNGDGKVSEYTLLTPSSETTIPCESITEAQPTADTDPIRRTVKQRKSDFNEYRATFLPVPKIIDRKPVFVSRTTRDRLDRIVRLFGERGMSVSGLIENIALHHLAVHETDIEHWRKM